MDKPVKEVLNSELAVKIMACLHSEGESYGSEIAEKLDKNQSSVARMISKLNHAGFIEETRREQAQYYKVNWEGVMDFWINELERSLEESEDKQTLQEWNKHRDAARNLGKDLVQNSVDNLYPEFIDSMKEATVDNILFDVPHMILNRAMIQKGLDKDFQSILLIALITRSYSGGIDIDIQNLESIE